MCIIVDANVARDLATKADDAIPVLRWLLKPNSGGGLIVGGKLTAELIRTPLRDTLVTLQQAGRLHRVDDAEIDAAADKIDKDNCRSNDVHIIATAVVSGCRLVYTKDQNLHKDMKNKKIIAPTASIYSSKKHEHLLTPCDCK